MHNTLIVFDAAGRELAREEAKSKAARMSVKGAADQRQLAALGQRTPGAASGRIGTACFVFRNGYPMWTGFADEA